MPNFVARGLRLGAGRYGRGTECAKGGWLEGAAGEIFAVNESQVDRRARKATVRAGWGDELARLNNMGHERAASRARAAPRKAWTSHVSELRPRPAARRPSTQLDRNSLGLLDHRLGSEGIIKGKETAIEQAASDDEAPGPRGGSADGGDSGAGVRPANALTAAFL